MTYIFLLGALALATYIDIKTRTIPLYLFPATLLISVFYNAIAGISMGVWNLLGFCCACIPSFATGMTGTLGGADIIMLSIIGLLLGEEFIIYTIILAVISTLFFLMTRLKNKNYPVAPFALISYILFLLWRIVYVYN